MQVKFIIPHLSFFISAALAAATAAASTTGFWHVEKIDGRDWAVAPDGRPTVLAGIDWVWPAGFFCEELGYSPYGRFVETNYPSREAWADETADRLHSWGFNLLGSGCDNKLLAPRGFVHTVMLNLGYRLAHDHDKTKALAPGLNRPGTAFPNVFHPDFETECDRAAAAAAAKWRDDPWLLGYFIDNELSWGGISRNRDEGMFDAAASFPPEHPARKALGEFVAECNRKQSTAIDNGESNRLQSTAIDNASLETKRDFLALVAERYFATMAGALRRHDPNHMVLGCRFAGMGASDVVLAAAGRHCDIVTFNCYPWADLDSGVMLTRKDGPPLADAIREFHAKCNAPLLMTEWSFSALDTGRPCSAGAGQRFRTQAERVQAAELCLRTMLSLPFQVGHCWFMWVDQPALGFNKYFHEDCNYGLVGEDGRPYAALTEMFARAHGEAARLRAAEPPKDRGPRQTASGQQQESERERFLAMAAANNCASCIVHYALSPDGAWTLSNGLVRLSGRIGALTMVEEVVRGGRVYGRCNALVMTTAPDWPPVTRLVSATPEEAPNGCGAVVLVGEGGGFAITIRLTMAPGSPEILAEILAAKNTGDKPLAIQKLFLCPIAVGDAPPKRIPTAINVWKGGNESYWRLEDGSRYGARSLDDSADGFNLWTEADGRQHADIPFRPATAAVTLVPGETLAAPRPMGAILVLDPPQGAAN